MTNLVLFLYAHKNSNRSILTFLKYLNMINALNCGKSSHHILIAAKSLFGITSYFSCDYMVHSVDGDPMEEI